ncbi:uncharacterized protein LOC110451180 [Mizuhopecten yessoensis]|uniref:Uncharacterized protein n=1 Tax=Mizuhopecten yessoensis TaxID=6573 RepID=A0A210QM71_MIZYE|nr:uncharacterized protein LOC110451180 [Mizuhopecten yessoensis]OWF49835.1 hypothetical protein KP79_PYT08307 [Mizuhopecten yessoensis]
MPGVAHLLAKSSNATEETMKNPMLLNNFMKEGSSQDSSSPPPMLGLLSRLKQAKEVNGNSDTREQSTRTRSAVISAETQKSPSLSNSLLDNFKAGLSVPNDNSKKSMPKENSILSRLKSSNAKVLNDSSSDRDALSSSQSSKQLHSKKLKKTTNLFSRRSMTPKSNMGDTGRSLDHSDSEFQDSDFDSEAGSPEPPPQPFWSTFEDSIIKINDQTDTMTLKPRPNFKGSEDFKDVMTDMFGNTEYGRAKSYTLLKEKISRLTNVSGMASRLFNNAAKKADEEAEEEEEEDEQTQEAAKAKDMENMRSELKGAKRGWKLLRRDVKETALAENTKESKLKWTMVRHHLTCMTDLDRARQDLYERYGMVPVAQEDGSMQCKNVMWSKRAIAMNMTHPSFYKLPSKSDGKKKKGRVQSARPASNTSRPLTSGTRVNARILPNRPASESRVKR